MLDSASRTSSPAATCAALVGALLVSAATSSCGDEPEPLPGEVWRRPLAEGVLGMPDLEEHGLVAVGDLDADGWPDCALGSNQPFPYYSDLPPESGAVVTFSGRTGEPLFRLDGRFRKFGFGETVAGVGDVDGDGHDDLAVADFHRLWVVSGRDGSELPGDFRLEPVTSVVGVVPTVDADGDGVRELLVAIDGGRAVGDTRLVRLSGATRAVLDERAIVGPDGVAPPGSLLLVADLGDLDRDGVSDVGVASRGSRSVRSDDPPIDPWVAVHSGSTLEPLAWLGAEVLGEPWLQDLRAGPDRTGDGVPDPLFLCRDELIAVSVAERTVVDALPMEGTRFQGAADFDGDGVVDPVVHATYFERPGTPFRSGAAVLVVSGAGLEPWREVDGGIYGLACTPGDLTGDGVPDLVVADGWLRLVSGAALR